MKIITTTGCTKYGTTIDDKDIHKLTTEQLLDIYNKVVNNLKSDFNINAEIAENISYLITIYGKYKHLYNCDECGDSVDEFVLDID